MHTRGPSGHGYVRICTNAHGQSVVRQWSNGGQTRDLGGMDGHQGLLGTTKEAAGKERSKRGPTVVKALPNSGQSVSIKDNYNGLISKSMQGGRWCKTAKEKIEPVWLLYSLRAIIYSFQAPGE